MRRFVVTNKAGDTKARGIEFPDGMVCVQSYEEQKTVNQYATNMSEATRLTVVDDGDKLEVLDMMSPAGYPRFREALADLEHKQWAHWTEHMLSVIADEAEHLSDPEEVYRVLESEPVRRWERQIKTPYADLSEEEKASDREWADKVLDVAYVYFERLHNVECAAEAALSDIVAMIGAPSWDYPGQVVRDVRSMVEDHNNMEKLLKDVTELHREEVGKLADEIAGLRAGLELGGAA